MIGWEYSPLLICLTYNGYETIKNIIHAYQLEI